MNVSQEGRLFNFFILNPLSKSNGAETEDQILFFGWLGVFFLLADGWRWDGVKSRIKPAEISPNVFGKKHE